MTITPTLLTQVSYETWDYNSTTDTFYPKTVTANVRTDNLLTVACSVVDTFHIGVVLPVDSV